MIGNAPAPYLSIVIGLPLVPDPFGANWPLQAEPLLNSNVSPGSKVKALTVASAFQGFACVPLGVPVKPQST